MRPEFSGEKARDSAFGQALATLKQEGCNVVVVGAGDVDAHAAICERLLGVDSPRRRLVVRTDPDVCCGSLPDVDAPGTLEVVSHGDAYDGEATVVDDDLLGPLGQAVAGTIDDLAGDDGGLEPAELRLCFDALGPLFAEHEPETVFRLVHVLTARVREVNGMGHFHVRVDESDGHVRLLEPLFDAVVTVRTRDGVPEHQWWLPDRDIESRWIEL